MGVPKFVGGFLKGKEYPGVLLENLPAVVSTLSLDLNGIFHAAAQQVYAYGDTSNPMRAQLVEKADPQFLEVELFNVIGTMMLNVITMVSPKDALIIAIDGLAPLAKMQQQRQRRYKAALEKTSGSVFDSNSITPGTAFMDKLNNYLQRWIYTNIMRFPPKIIYSSHMVPGEGEHKIFDLIRQSRKEEEEEGKEEEEKIKGKGPKSVKDVLYDNRKVHVIYGLDADLIMLSLIAPLENIQLMREDVRNIVHIGNLRRAISYELKSKTAIEDFVIMMYLLGNDFLPHHPGFEDMINSLDKLFEVYRNLEKPLSEEGKINFNHMSEFLGKVAEIEPALMHEVAQRDFVYPSRMIEGAVVTTYNNEGKVRTLDFNRFRSLWYLNALGFRGREEFIEEIFEKFKLPKELQVIDPDEVVRMCEQYLVSLEWVFQYYQHGSSGVSDKHLYPFFHCPLIKDLADVSRQIKVNTKEIQPDTGIWKFSILHQILIVIPPRSKKIVPPEILSLYDNDSFIVDCFPERFILEKDGKDKTYQFLPIVPFVDPYRIITAVDTLNLPIENLKRFVAEETIIINASEIGGKYDEQANLRQRINQMVHRGNRGRSEGFQRGPPPKGKVLGEQKFQSREGSYEFRERRGSRKGSYEPRGSREGSYEPGGRGSREGSYIPRGRGGYAHRGKVSVESTPRPVESERGSYYIPRGRGSYVPRGRGSAESRSYVPRGKVESGSYVPRGRVESGSYVPRGTSYTSRGRGLEYQRKEESSMPEESTYVPRERSEYRGRGREDRGRGRSAAPQNWTSLKVLL